MKLSKIETFKVFLEPEEDINNVWMELRKQGYAILSIDEVEKERAYNITVECSKTNIKIQAPSKSEPDFPIPNHECIDCEFCVLIHVQEYRKFGIWVKDLPRTEVACSIGGRKRKITTKQRKPRWCPFLNSDVNSDNNTDNESNC